MRELPADDREFYTPEVLDPSVITIPLLKMLREEREQRRPQPFLYRIIIDSCFGVMRRG